MIDRTELLVTVTDSELYLIASGGRRTEDELEMKVIPPMPSKD
jgi:hypothetical protein